MEKDTVSSNILKKRFISLLAEKPGLLNMVMIKCIDVLNYNP